MGMSALLAEATRLVTMFQDKEKSIKDAVAAAVARDPADDRVHRGAGRLGVLGQPLPA